jgi:probable F420-dependent oxidoreductase
VKFGVASFVTDEGIRPAELGVALEERGFESFVVPEHTHIPASRATPYPAGGDLPRMYYRTLDPFVTLTAVAAVTKRLVIGTGILLLVERDPITTAKEVASLDLVSGGRFIFGVGAGWNLEEMRNHGTDPLTRGRLLDERIVAMQRLWTEEEAEFQGDLVHMEKSFAWPKPVQKPYPPIYFGGNSDATFRRIAKYGHGWLANAHPPGVMGTRIARLRDLAEREVPVSVFGAPSNADTLRAYAGLGIERVTLFLRTKPRDETLSILDAMAKLVAELS